MDFNVWLLESCIMLDFCVAVRIRIGLTVESCTGRIVPYPNPKTSFEVNTQPDPNTKKKNHRPKLRGRKKVFGFKSDFGLTNFFSTKDSNGWIPYVKSLCIYCLINIHFSVWRYRIESLFKTAVIWFPPPLFQHTWTAALLFITIAPL